MYNYYMLEFERKHRRGIKTFLYLLFTKAWWLLLIGAGFLYLSWLMYFGSLKTSTANFLAEHADWYVSVGMLSQWMMLLGISFLFIAYLLANVEHRYYKFILDEYAIHIHNGLFFVQEITIPYEQITNVHIARPIRYRFFGIAELDIVTAADKDFDRRETRNKKFLLPMIDTSIARILARQLLECASKSRNGEHVYAKEIEEEFEEEESEL